MVELIEPLDLPVVVEADGPVAETAGLPPAALVAGSGIVGRTAPAAAANDAGDDYDISGYDLSRYDMPAAADEPLQLVGTDDPDAADDDDDEDDEVVGAGAGGRRRSRRGGTRRRTRP